MNDGPIERKTLISYLMEQLPPQDREELDLRLFEKDETAAELLAAEEDLMEAYLSDELDSESRKRFETLYLAKGARLDSFELYRAIRSASRGLPSQNTNPPAPVRPRSWFVAGLAACLAAAVAGFCFLAIENVSLRNQLRTVQLASVQRQHEASAGRVPSPPEMNPTKPPVAQASPVFELKADLAREGGDTHTIRLSQKNETFLLALPLNEVRYRDYRVEIQTMDQTTVFSVQPLRPTARASGQALMIALSAGQLTHGDYVVLVEGKNEKGTYEDAAEFYFRLE